MFGWGKATRHTLTLEGQAAVTLEKHETVLNGALRHGLAFPHSCKVGGCGACKCRLVTGQVRELTDKSYLLSPDELAANYILGCQSIPQSDVVVQLPVQPFAGQRVTGTLARQRPLTHDISEIGIELDAPLRYRPGQHASLCAIDVDLPARCYSFAHAAPDDGTHTAAFFVRRVPGGGMSHWLCDAGSLGQRIEINASLGDFHLREGDGALLCVAGGSGLAPLIALLEGAAASGATQRPVHLLMGARTQRDLYYGDEIAALQARWQAPFDYVPVLSEEAADSDWPGARGWVTEAITPERCIGAQGYLCGPPPMIDAAIAVMTAQGIAPEQIFFDKFSDQSAQ